MPIYVQNIFPAKLHYDHMRDEIEALCVHPPYLQLRNMFDKFSDMTNEIYLLGDMDIDWLGRPGTNKNKDISILNNRYQILAQPTRKGKLRH